MSAYESIGFGDIKNINDKSRLEEIAKITGIHTYIKSLPKKYDTPLVRDLEGGVGLSTGQWQKLAISRALFRKAQLLILDEPTSNLDPASEEEIFNKLISNVDKKIMILISHRFSTVRQADKIFVLDGGTIKEQGSHKELIAQNGLYTRLFRLQSKSYEE